MVATTTTLADAVVATAAPGPGVAEFERWFAMLGPIPTDRALAMEAQSAAYLLFCNLRREAGMLSTDWMPPLPSEAPHLFIGSAWAPTTMGDTPVTGGAAASTTDGGPTPAADVSMENE